MNYRKPTASDIGKTVEVSSDGNVWTTTKLARMWIPIDDAPYCCAYGFWWRFCRVPYSCPDPIAELSEAADRLIELGAPEAARVLMAEIERRSQNARMQASVERLIADGLGVLPDESRPNWEEHEHRYYVYRNANREPVVALRFETAEVYDAIERSRAAQKLDTPEQEE